MCLPSAYKVGVRLGMEIIHREGPPALCVSGSRVCKVCGFHLFVAFKE